MILPHARVNVDIDKFGHPERPRRTVKMTATRGLKKLLASSTPLLEQDLTQDEYDRLILKLVELDEALGGVREELTDLVGDLLGYFLVEQVSTSLKRTRLWPRLTPSSSHNRSITSAFQWTTRCCFGYMRRIEGRMAPSCHLRCKAPRFTLK